MLHDKKKGIEKRKKTLETDLPICQLADQTRSRVVDCGLSCRPRPTPFPPQQMQNVPIGDPCWLPAFDVKLRDMSKCVCPMRAYKSVKVTCSEEGAFDVLHASSSSSTHQMGRLMSEGDGPLEYDEVR